MGGPARAEQGRDGGGARRDGARVVDEAQVRDPARPDAGLRGALDRPDPGQARSGSSACRYDQVTTPPAAR